MAIDPTVLAEFKTVPLSGDPARAAMSCLTARPNASDFANVSRALLKQADMDLSSLPEESIAVLGDCTTQCIAAAIPLVLASLGRLCRLYEAPYDTWRMEFIDPTSGYSRFDPTLTVLALSTHRLPRPESFADTSTVEALAHSVVDEIVGLWEVARERTGTLLVHHNFALPPETPRGRLELRYAWTDRRFVRRVNELLWDKEGDGVRILDVETLASRVGEAAWLEPRWFYHSKHPFSPALIADYALGLRGTVATALGLSRKILVTDLDDTLWGGSVGDVGPAAVEIGPGTTRGEAHLDFARYLKALKERGVVLAINSRNNMETVEQAFSVQKHLPLVLQDFASVHCHWDAKSMHLRQIAQELNVGLDALVFVDDDAFQCEEVRSSCPEIVTVLLPDERANYVQALDRLHLFDVGTLTADDAVRTETYRASVAVRNAATGNLDSFLAGLHQVGMCRLVRTSDLDRAEQLFAKTNQFNLTQARLTRAELEKLGNSSGGLVWVCELADRLTHYGVVAGIAAREVGEDLEVLNWVTSCRVFSRTFEAFILNQLCEWAAGRRLARVYGVFSRTDRNQYALEFLKRERLWEDVPEETNGMWGILSGRRLKTFVEVEREACDV